MGCGEHMQDFNFRSVKCEDLDFVDLECVVKFDDLKCRPSNSVIGSADRQIRRSDVQMSSPVACSRFASGASCLFTGCLFNSCLFIGCPLPQLPVHRLPVRRLRAHRLPLHGLPVHRVPVHRLPVPRLPIHRLQDCIFTSSLCA